MNQEQKNRKHSPIPDQESTDLDEKKTIRAPFGGWIERLKAWLANGQKLTQTRKAIVLNDLIESASPGVDFFVLIILSCIIATFGLIIDSPAVIIGAMLVAPLMSPILGLSMASISGLSHFLKRSMTAVLAGVGAAVVLSALLSFVAYRLPYGPLANISNEVLARTSPSLIDLGIALAGGSAAAYALAHPRLSAALPGVAIATALMPPICTIGIGISFLNPSIILGATLLFATNLVSISFAGSITFAMMGFGPRRSSDKDAISHSLRISAMLVLAISIPLAFFGWNSVREARLYSNASSAIIESVSELAEIRLVDLAISSEGGTKNIDVVLRTSRELSHDEVLVIQSAVADRLESPVSLEMVTVPMQVLNPMNPPTPTPTATP